MPLKKILLDHWKEIVLALISTGFVGQLVGVWDVTIKREDSYIEKYIDCKEEIIVLNRKFDRVLNRLNTIELMAQEIPFASWNKDKTGVITFVNSEYKKLILDPRNIDPLDFLNTRGEALGDEFVSQISINDMKVMSERKLIVFKESIPDLGSGMSYKYPLYNNFQDVIGTGGMWIPITDR